MLHILLSSFLRKFNLNISPPLQGLFNSRMIELVKVDSRKSFYNPNSYLVTCGHIVRRRYINVSCWVSKFKCSDIGWVLQEVSYSFYLILEHMIFLNVAYY